MSDDLVPDFKIEIAGSPLPSTLLQHFKWLEVKQSIRLIDMCSICFESPGGSVADASQFKQGNEVKVEIGWLGKLKWAFKGDIVSIEPDFPVGGTPQVTVRAYDRLHRYRRGRKQRTFLNQKVSDVVSTLAGEDGLAADVQDTGLQHEYLLQNNQTNIEYIHELARRHGYEVDVVNDGAKLFFKKPRYDVGSTLSLEWREQLKSFYARKSLDNVATKVTTRYWNMKEKRAVVESHDRVHGELGAKDVAPKEANKAFGAAEVQLSLRPNTAPAEAKALAESVFNEKALEAVKGRATAVGNTAIKPGMVVELTGLGKTWSGQYYVIGANHVVDRVAGYTTELEVRRTGTGYAFQAKMAEPPSS